MESKGLLIEQEKILNEQPLFLVKDYQSQQVQLRLIGAVVSLNKNKKKCHGSGFLISNNLVLTAAHNLYDKDKKQQNEQITFYLSVNGLGKKYQVENWKYMQEYKTCLKIQSLPYDFALLKLKNPVYFTNNHMNKKQTNFGKQKYFPLQISCQECLKDKKKQAQLSIFGFPSHSSYANYKNQDSKGEIFTLHHYGLTRNNRIIEIKEIQIHYGLSTNGGQSGCPIIIENKVIGIHIGAGTNQNLFNVGRLIDLPLVNYLKDWCKQMNGNPFNIYCNQSFSHLQQRQKKLLQKQNIKSLDLESKELGWYVTSLFNNLIELNLSNNHISAIDISKNIHLVHLSLSNNQIFAINLTNNTKLVQLYLNCNELQTIDVTKNKNLSKLYLNYNKISEIDIKNNSDLVELYLHQNQISKIDVSNNPNLTTLFLNNNKLQKLDVTNNVNLQELLLQQNKLNSVALLLSSKMPIENYLSWRFNFSHQHSGNCTIIIRYNNAEDKNKCSQLSGWVTKYQEQRVASNKYGCKYAFQLQKI